MDSCNARLVKLNAAMQRDDIVIDPMEQEIYNYIKETLKIESLRTSVMNSAELLSRNAEQRQAEAEKKRDNRTQAIMGLFALLGISSACVDCFDFVGKFVRGGEWSTLTENEKGMELLFLLIIAGIGIVTAVFAVRAIISAFHKEKPGDERNADTL